MHVEKRQMTNEPWEGKQSLWQYWLVGYGSDRRLARTVEIIINHLDLVCVVSSTVLQ